MRVCTKVRVTWKAHDQGPTASAEAATRDPVGLEHVDVWTEELCWWGPVTQHQKLTCRPTGYFSEEHTSC